MSESSPPVAKDLWLAILIPPVVWAVQGLFGWYAAAHGCVSAQQRWSLTTARILIIVVSVLALGVSVTALLRSVRRHRLADESPRLIYLSMLGLLVGATITFGIFVAGLPAVIVHVCGEAR